jgi:glycosyltransferase involved in cell wall biosynthesis
MKLAFLITHFTPPIGGAERQADFLCRLISAELGGCEVVTTRFRPDLPSRSVSDGVLIRRLATFGRKRVRLASNLAVSFLYFLWHGRRYRIVHAHCLSAFSLGGIIAAKLWGCRVLVKVCSIGKDGEADIVKRSLLGTILWKLFLRADLFVAATPSVLEDLVGHGVARDRIVVVPNAVIIDHGEGPERGTRDAARAALGLPDRPTVLVVGRIVREKGVDLLTRAWAALARRTSAMLALVGDGPEATRVVEWRRAAGCEESVRLFGWQSDPEPFYQAADIFVFPSRNESFGNALAEAMAHGLAVVTTPVGLARHWIRDGENGILISQDTPEELVEALSRLVHDASLRQRLGQQARRDALAHFAPESVIGTYLELYRRLDQNPNASGDAGAGLTQRGGTYAGNRTV